MPHRFLSLIGRSVCRSERLLPLHSAIRSTEGTPLHQGVIFRPVNTARVVLRSIPRRRLELIFGYDPTLHPTPEEPPWRSLGS